VISKAKEQINNLFKTQVERASERFPDRDFMMTHAYVQAFLARHDFVVDCPNPEFVVRQCYHMFAGLRLKTQVVKAPGDPNAPAVRRFTSFREGISHSLDSLDPASAVTVIKVMDRALRDTRYVERWSADVAWHFVTSSSGPLKGRLITEVIRRFRPKNCLELGTAYSLGTAYMATAKGKYAPDGMIWTIELGQEQFDFSSALLNDFFEGKVEPVFGSIQDEMPKLLHNGFDLVFHDGGHAFENYTGDFKAMLPGLNEGAVVIFDDIRWDDRRFIDHPSRCYEGWLEVIANPRVLTAFEVNGDFGVLLVGPK